MESNLLLYQQHNIVYQFYRRRQPPGSSELLSNLKVEAELISIFLAQAHSTTKFTLIWHSGESCLLGLKGNCGTPPITRATSKTPRKAAVWPEGASAGTVYSMNGTPNCVFGTTNPGALLLPARATYSTRPLFGPPGTVS